MIGETTFDLILSVAMIAVVALGWGGVWQLRKERDRTRAWLMIAAAAVLLGNVLIWTV